MYTKNIFLFLAVFSFLLFSCKTKTENNQTIHIPNDANVVVTLNTKNILQKLENGNVNIDDLFKQSGQNTLPQRFTAARNAIDINEPVYYFTKSKNTIASGNVSFSGVVATLKNESALTDYLSKFEQGATINKTEQFSFVQGNNGLVGWNDGSVIFLTSQDQQQLANLFIMSPELSMSANDVFSKSLQPSSDATFFVNTSSFLMANPMLAASKLSILMKDTYTTGNLNFNQGAVEGDLQTVYGQAFQEMIQNNPSQGSNADLLNKYPEQPAAFTTLSVNPALLKSLVEYAGIQAVAEQYLSGMGISIADIVNALGGNVNIAASAINLNAANNGKVNLSSLFSGNYISTIDIKNKSVIDRIASGLSSVGMLSNTGGVYSLSMLGAPGSKGFIKVDTSKIIYTSSTDFITRYNLTSAPSNVSQDVVSLLNGKVFAFYINAQTAFNQYASSNPFKDFYIYQDKLSGNASKGAIALRLNNTADNSLIALINFLQSFSKGNAAPSALPSVQTTDPASGIPEEDVIADTAALRGLKP